jgi:hypothetical protein
MERCVNVTTAGSCSRRDIQEELKFIDPVAALYGTIARKRNAANITKCTRPWSTVVRRVPKVITPTRRVIASSHLFFQIKADSLCFPQAMGPEKVSARGSHLYLALVGAAHDMRNFMTASTASVSRSPQIGFGSTGAPGTSERSSWMVSLLVHPVTKTMGTLHVSRSVLATSIPS